METQNARTLCEQARLYYYDLLCGQSCQEVPREIVNHVEQCRYCQQQMDGLKQALSATAKDRKSSRAGFVTAITDVLRLHLAYVGKPVSCEIAKSFLPSLSIPTLEIKVPTPITVHLDKCRQCSQDLEDIRRLNLTQQQLYRLSEFLGEESCDCPYVDDKKRTAAKLVAEMDWQLVTADTLKHSCKCSLCRDLVYEERQKMLDGISGSGKPKDYPCEGISQTVIFDYVFPYGLAPADDQYLKFRGSFVEHAVKCPACLSKMQQLHSELDAIVSRGGSDVVTMFYKGSCTKGESLDETDRIYEGFPVRVETATEGKPEAEPMVAAAAVPVPSERRSQEPGRSIINFTAVRKKLSKIKLSYDLKAGIAACIIIAVGLTMFFYNPAGATPTPLDKINQAMQKVSNVHTMQFVPGKKAPVSERWVSKTLGIDRTTDDKKTILYDISKKIGKSKLRGGNSIEVSQLSNDDVTDIKQNITRYFGLIPLTDSPLVPKGAEWSRVSNDALGVPKGIEVYDITWKIKSGNGTDLFRKRRFFADSRTFLPKKEESYKKSSAQEDYVLISTGVIEYPSDKEMQKVMDERSF